MEILEMYVLSRNECQETERMGITNINQTLKPLETTDSKQRKAVHLDDGNLQKYANRASYILRTYPQQPIIGAGLLFLVIGDSPYEHVRAGYIVFGIRDIDQGTN